MKNKFWIIILFIIIIGICLFVYFYSRKNSNQNDYTSSRTSTNNIDNSSNDNTSQNDKNISNTTTTEQPKTEVLISTFSTKIYNKESDRQNNITLCCQSLNDITISNGSTFSFCDTLGPATPDKGYQEADVFDKNGNKIQGYGGGKCQVSTTLYNAVLQVPELVVTERHPHSNKVPYIETGKDAAVSYGSYDLKFRNDTGYDVKIRVLNTVDDITVTLYKMV